MTMLSQHSHRHFELQQAFGDPVHWWRAGGTVKDIDTIEAWQAVCQPNYAASLIGLAHGAALNDVNKAAIAWSEADGWIGDGLGYFITAITPVFPYESGSVFLRCSGNPQSSYLCGACDNTNFSQFFINNALVPIIKVDWWNGSNVGVEHSESWGGIVPPIVMGFSGKVCYLNGTPIGTLPAGGNVNVLSYYIMAQHLSGVANGKTLMNLQAIAFYSIALSPSQAAILSSLMLGLCGRRPFILDQSALDGKAELQ